MNKVKKKGFTIVELVIVIAVIAILAAVLIPTFTNLIKKANTSADIQACRQMNTYLAVNEVTEDRTIVEVYKALEAGGMNAKNYTPLSADTYYFWDVKLNRILYTDKEYKVIYPEEYKDVTGDAEGHSWFALNAKIREEEYSKEETEAGVKLSVSTGGQLYSAINDLPQSTDKIVKDIYFKNSINKNTEIVLNADIDMKGSSFSLGAVAKNTSLTIDGQGHTISGISNLNAALNNVNNNEDNAERSYYTGLVKYVNSGATVTIKNIKFDNVVVGDPKVGSSSFLICYVGYNATVNIEGVSITDSTLYGANKLGAFIGAAQNANNTISVKKSCEGGSVETKLDNVKIISSEGESGILFGSTANSGANNKDANNIKIDSTLFADGYEFIKNCSVVCNSDKKITAGITLGESDCNQTLDGCVVEKSDTPGSYRVTTAFYGFAGTGAKVNFTLNEEVKEASAFEPMNNKEQLIVAGWIYDFAAGAKFTA